MSLEKLKEIKNYWDRLLLLQKKPQETASQIELLANWIVQDCISVLNEQLQEANFFKDVSGCESIDRYNEYSLKLDQIYKIHAAFPGKLDLMAFKDIQTTSDLHQKVDTFIETNSMLSKQLAYNANQLNVIADHIKKRGEFVNTVIPDIEAMIRSLPEKNNHTNFANDLVKMLVLYKKTGHGDQLAYEIPLALKIFQAGKGSEHCLDEINQEIKPSSEDISPLQKAKLFQLMNRIFVQIIDAKRLFPKDYSEQAEKGTDLHSLAYYNLVGAEAFKSPEYVSGMKELYAKVEELRQHGDTIKPFHPACAESVIELAQRLTYDIDLFLVENDGKKPGPESVNNFIDIFKARLGSKSEEMGEHRAIWKPIVLNILIGLATLGIALMVRYAATQSFFFDKTRREEHIEDISQTMTSLVVP